MRRVLLCLAILIAGCATNPMTGKREFSIVSESQEIAMGQEGHQQVIEEFGVYDEKPELNQLVESIGRRIAAASDRPNLPWHFTLLDSSIVNAMALPGGYIYVTRGIIERMNAEDELAGVIAHVVQLGAGLLRDPVDVALLVWFALTALSTLYVAIDLFTRTPEMKVMKWGWVLVTLYAGPVAFVVYWLSCREPAPGTHEKFVAPLWKQSVGSTLHCLAGDATGIIVAAAVTAFLGLPMYVDSIVEYAAGFAFGLFVFQALFTKDMLGGSYSRAVRATLLPEWLSMNAVMAGMIPVMVILMSRDMRAMEPSSARFWGVMSLATLAGAVLAFPVNVWLVKNRLKHGMGTERALGKGGAPKEHETMAMDAAPPVSSARKCFVAFVTMVMLGLGTAVAARFGNFTMTRPMNKPMPMQMK